MSTISRQQTEAPVAEVTLTPSGRAETEPPEGETRLPLRRSRLAVEHKPPLAAAVAASVTVLAVPALTRWAYASATGTTDLTSRLVDPVFEVRDKLVWLVALVSAGAIGLIFTIVSPSKRWAANRWRYALIAGPGIVAVVGSAAYEDEALGLGPVNVLLALALLPLLIRAFGPLSAGAMRFVWAGSAVAGILVYLPSLWQTPQGLYDPWHASHIIDEILGPTAGRLPLGQYVPQYGGLLGIPLAPFHSLVSHDVETWVTSYLSVLSIITIALLCLAAALMLPRGRSALGPLLVVPVLLMKPSGAGIPLPVGVEGFYSAIPERSLLPACVAVLMLLLVSRPRWRSGWLCVGAASGMAALSNVESGAPASLAVLLVLFAVRARRQQMVQWVVGWLAVGATYALMLFVTGQPLVPRYWVAFALEFAGGFGALPMPAFGNYIFILIVLVAGMASALPVLRRCHSGRNCPTAAVGGLYFSAWGMLTFPYYVARSSTWGQLQFFLISTSMTAVWLLICGLSAARSARSLRAVPAVVLLMCLPAAIFVTAVIKVPSPKWEWLRLSGFFGESSAFRSTQWKGGREDVVNPVKAARIQKVSQSEKGPVAIFFQSGNVVSLKTGLPNASLFAAPEELLPNRGWTSFREDSDPGSVNFRRLQCQSLQDSDIQTVVADVALAEGLRCPGFSRSKTLGDLAVITRDGR